MISTQFAFADTGSKIVSVEYLENGDYIVTIIEDVSTEYSMARTITTTTKSKTVNYNNANGETMWYVKVTGTFRYGEGSAECLSATPSAAAYNSYWSVHNISGTKYGATASASATGKRTVNGVVVQTVPETVTLTCSSTGQFS